MTAKRKEMRDMNYEVRVLFGEVNSKFLSAGHGRLPPPHALPQGSPSQSHAMIAVLMRHCGGAASVPRTDCHALPQPTEPGCYATPSCSEGSLFHAMTLPAVLDQSVLGCCAAGV